MDIFIHHTALVETSEIGEGTDIWAFTHILNGARIGKNCNIGDHCYIEAGAVVGNNVTIKNGNMLCEGVTIEDGVFIGPYVSFTNDLYPRSPRLPQVRQRYTTKQWLVNTRVKKGASLGAGTIILAGITVDEYAMVGAGAVITKNTPPYSLLIGNPARIVGYVCQCGKRLNFIQESAICKECNLEFRKSDNFVSII